MREMKCLTAADLAAGSGGFPQVGEIRMAFAVRAAMRSLAAIPERRKIARIAARPAAGARRQVDDGEPPVDRVLIDKIGGELYLALDRFVDGDVRDGIINCRHGSLSSGICGKHATSNARGDAPQAATERGFCKGCRRARLVAVRQSSAFSGHGPAFAQHELGFALPPGAPIA
jgi:hypothetical protein